MQSLKAVNRYPTHPTSSILPPPRAPKQTKTDDSFTFARAIKRLREAIEALGDVTGGGEATDGTAGEGDDGEGTGSAGNGVSLSLERKMALILVMKEAFKSYHLAWARSSIEPAFKVRIRYGRATSCILMAYWLPVA